MAACPSSAGQAWPALACESSQQVVGAAVEQVASAAMVVPSAQICCGVGQPSAPQDDDDVLTTGLTEVTVAVPARSSPLPPPSASTSTTATIVTTAAATAGISHLGRDERGTGGRPGGNGTRWVGWLGPPGVPWVAGC